MDRHRRTSKLIRWGSLLALWLLAACTAQTSSYQTSEVGRTVVRETSGVSSTAIPTPLPPTSTRQISPTPTPQPTPQPSNTPAPSASPSPTPFVCRELAGQVEQNTLSDPRLKLPMEYRVYLPPCYAAQPERRYPVLYLIHGMNFNEDQWDRLGADEAADKLIAASQISPLIIVMPRDRNWDEPDLDPFGEVVIEALLPLIDRSYRTLPDREHRAVGGLSRGAGWAIHFGLSHWELFGAIGGHSPPVFWSDTPRVRAWLKAIPPGELPRIYLDIGDHDRPSISESATWFEKLLTGSGIPHEWHLNPGFHDEAYWSSHVEQYLRWYAADW